MTWVGSARRQARVLGDQGRRTATGEDADNPDTDRHISSASLMMGARIVGVSWNLGEGGPALDVNLGEARADPWQRLRQLDTRELHARDGYPVIPAEHAQCGVLDAHNTLDQTVERGAI